MRIFDFDVVMEEIKNRVIEELVEEISEQTRFGEESIGLDHTALYFGNEDREAGTVVEII